MKRMIKMLGLSAVAALAAMAFVGATSASATTVCGQGEPEGGTCPAGWGPYSGELSGALAPEATAVLNAGSTVITCTNSEVTGATNAAGEGEITALSFTGGGGSASQCSTNRALWPNATVTTFPPYGAAAVWKQAGAPQGELVVEAPTVRITLEGLGNITCEVGLGENVAGATTNGTPSTVAFNATLQGKGEFPCPAEGLWTATYTLAGGAGQNIQLYE